MSEEKAYCRCCGQLCQPEAYNRPAEDYDGGTMIGLMVKDWRSPCCLDAVSSEPVTDQCHQCGEVAARGAEFPKIDDVVVCPNCLGDYRLDR